MKALCGDDQHIFIETRASPLLRGFWHPEQISKYLLGHYIKSDKKVFENAGSFYKSIGLRIFQASITELFIHGI